MIGRQVTSGELDGVSVHVGFPNPALDGSLDTLDLNRLLVSHPAGTYFMRIAGNDWQEVGIWDGDIILVDRVTKPQKADLVIWWEGESFIISNLPAVPEKTPVWGVVTTVIHQYRDKS
jgi:DNA polymerase V